MLPAQTWGEIYFLIGTKVEGAKDGDEAMFDLAKDIAALRAAFRANPNIRIFIIDPLTAYLGAGTKAKENAEVRRVLTPLVKLAEETGVLVLANSHLNKGTGKALYRVLDSIAFIALGRTVHLVAKDADNPDNRKFICDKTNIGSKPLGLTYSIEKFWITAPRTGEEIETSRICWGSSHIDETADEALAAPEQSDPTMTEDVVEFLQIVLANGPMAVTDIEREAREARVLDEGRRLRSPSLSGQPKKFLASQATRRGLLGVGAGSYPQGDPRRHEDISAKNGAPSMFGAPSKATPTPSKAPSISQGALILADIAVGCVGRLGGSRGWQEAR